MKKKPAAATSERPAPTYARPLDARWRELEDIAAHDALPDARRLALAREVAAALGPDYVGTDALVGTRGLAAIEHGPTAARLLVVPGGAYAMGISDAELAELTAVITPDGKRAKEVAGYLAAARPVHTVRVRPFLCAERLLDAEKAEALAPGIADVPMELGTIDIDSGRAALNAKQVGMVLRATPFRLVCDAEWEWLAREGGAGSWVYDPRTYPSFAARSKYVNALGLRDLISDAGEWVADRWFPNHDGAPSDAVARAQDAKPGTHRGAHFSWQDSMEAIVTHAATREQATEKNQFGVRFALDLPG